VLFLLWCSLCNGVVLKLVLMLSMMCMWVLFLIVLICCSRMMWCLLVGMVSVLWYLIVVCVLFMRCA